MQNENDECLGCGWSFADGGEVLTMRVYDDDGGQHAANICVPCAHTHHSFHAGRPLSTEASARSQHTNLILKAIRDAGAQMPEPTDSDGEVE